MAPACTLGFNPILVVGEVIHHYIFVTAAYVGYTVGEYFHFFKRSEEYVVFYTLMFQAKLRKMHNSPYTINLAYHKLHKLQLL